ncbi:hypothetical protein A3768_5580 (plasmid) [Ralstonia solanacearum]|nr:hypothetical protein A3768_5580 [Ralstonia solanacearum]
MASVSSPFNRQSPRTVLSGRNLFQHFKNRFRPVFGYFARRGG